MGTVCQETYGKENTKITDYFKRLLQLVKFKTISYTSHKILKTELLNVKCSVEDIQIIILKKCRSRIQQFKDD